VAWSVRLHAAADGPVPILIAPLFDRFTPLAVRSCCSGSRRCWGVRAFHTSGVYTMDGSRRSSHGNAYFTGWGRPSRIVFFDTLRNGCNRPRSRQCWRMKLGHFRLRHVRKRLLLGFVASGADAGRPELADAAQRGF